MRLIDIVNGPWAITPEMLLEIQGIYATHLRGEKINLPEVEARIGKPLANSRMGTQIQDGVAVISMNGAIAKRMNLFAEISGGVSSELVGKEITTALNNPDVKGIILNIDSPGGTVDGTQELANIVAAASQQKPMLAFSDGMIASAAYWIASACASIHISGDTNPIGSIGVVAAHRDYSKSEEKSGVKTTEISAGKYKRIASQYAPLSDDGHAEIQEKVDYLYSVFVNDVATNRAVSVETVLADMADGRMFTGRQSIKSGLVDGIATLDSLVELLQSPQTREEITKKQRKKLAMEENMNIEILRADHADLVEQITSAAKAGMIESTEAEKATTAAVAAERSRIMELVSASFGAEPAAKLSAVVEKGLTAEEMQTLGIIVCAPPEPDSSEAMLAALKNVAPQGLNPLQPQGNEERSAAISAIAAGGSK
jgi:signal peptide peptidase SppA